jgi:sodium/hydrogen exchanger 10/11
MEDFTKVMIIQTSIAVRKFRWNVRKYIPPRRISMKPDSESEFAVLGMIIRICVPFIK